jgi:asparagine synthase (glutamine-hydrolysing)
MCGIAAVVNGGSVRADLERMVHAQSHRGPDAQGLHVSVSGRAGLGHNRLTIIDRSDAGLQPMSTPDGRLWMVFNGEIYNYRELRAELDDYPFRGQSDSEVRWLHERWGRDCVSRFIGMFAFVI